MSMNPSASQELIAACRTLKFDEEGVDSTPADNASSPTGAMGGDESLTPAMKGSNLPTPAKQRRRGVKKQFVPTTNDEGKRVSSLLALTSFGGGEGEGEFQLPKKGKVKGKKRGAAFPSTSFETTSPMELEPEIEAEMPLKPCVQEQIRCQGNGEVEEQEHSQQWDDEKEEREAQAAAIFGNHRFYAGDLTIIMNLFKGKICINMRKYSRDGKLQEAVTINPEEFMWLTQSSSDSPPEGEYNRIDSSRNSQGFFVVSRIDGVKNVRVERLVVISSYTYKKLLNKKEAIREKVLLANKLLGCDDSIEFYREMIVLLAREDYKQRIFSEDAQWDEEMADYQAKSCLESVKFGLLKAVFAACNYPRPDAISTSELIGMEEKSMVENIISGELSSRARTMFLTFLDHVSVVLKGFANSSYPPRRLEFQ